MATAGPGGTAGPPAPEGATPCAGSGQRGRGAFANPPPGSRLAGPGKRGAPPVGEPPAPGVALVADPGALAGGAEASRGTSTPASGEPTDDCRAIDAPPAAPG